ncbi:hypothetical protein HK102_009233 [Quaeritorhiza haematococci]|nr:hypothetical protein HK102_009233 [Quaeritorhiza haematococci]
MSTLRSDLGPSLLTSNDHLNVNPQFSVNDDDAEHESVGEALGSMSEESSVEFPRHASASIGPEYYQLHLQHGECPPFQTHGGVAEYEQATRVKRQQYSGESEADLARQARCGAVGGGGDYRYDVEFGGDQQDMRSEQLLYQQGRNYGNRGDYVEREWSDVAVIDEGGGGTEGESTPEHDVDVHVPYHHGEDERNDPIGLSPSSSCFYRSPVSSIPPQLSYHQQNRMPEESPQRHAHRNAHFSRQVNHGNNNPDEPLQDAYDQHQNLHRLQRLNLASPQIHASNASLLQENHHLHRTITHLTNLNKSLEQSAATASRTAKRLEAENRILRALLALGDGEEERWGESRKQVEIASAFLKGVVEKGKEAIEGLNEGFQGLVQLGTLMNGIGKMHAVE